MVFLFNFSGSFVSMPFRVKAKVPNRSNFTIFPSANCSPIASHLVIKKP